MEMTDRAVQALREMGWAVVPGDTDLPIAVATVLRVVREDLVAAMERAWPDSMGQWTADQADAARSMKERALEIVRQVGAASKPEPTVALVTVDEQGRLTPDSTVTVGEWTWPVPEQTLHLGVLGTGRIAAALKERGYRLVRGAEQDYTQPGFARIPVEPIESKEH